MTQIIYAVRQNQAVLLEAANSLVDIIEAKVLVDSHPQLVAEICTSLLNIGAELTNVARPTAFIADSLTTLSIQLHRQPALPCDWATAF
jgi:signal-transduction protein with cAMP-binding, CBS, and nucleotidyltransferase domain